ITIGWANMDAQSMGASLKENDVLVSLSFVAKVAKGSVALTTAEGSQFADAEGNTLHLAKLTANTVEIGAVPSVFELAQNYPNPFNPTTTIRFGIPATSNVVLKIFDIVGKEVVALVNGELSAGYYSYEWNASTKPSGMYFYRMTAASQSGEKREAFTQVRKLLLVK
ncbi:MAG: T9SS type A sorting domain-containing protein, partial [Ignavibacteriales bacterium]|nr:T9SS type A sorting domain-containing protein [Ignavibacteriales bacterium]